MSKDARSQKLDSVAKCLTRLEDKRPPNVSDLESNLDLQEIIVLNIERLVQLSTDAALILIADRNWLPLPDTMARGFHILAHRGIIDSNLADRLAKAVGFRNLSVHEYDKINWAIVFSIVTNHLDDFRSFAKLVDSQV